MDGNNEGKWREMFEATRGGGGRGMGAPAAPPPLTRDEPPMEDALELDLTDYKPWVLQRGRSRPAMMLHLRRYEEKSGLWMGWQLAYHTLAAVEYIGGQMLSLDFGKRQFMIEGTGLDELARHLQQGTVLAL